MTDPRIQARRVRVERERGHRRLGIVLGVLVAAGVVAGALDHLHLFADLVEAASHEPLDRVHGILRIGDRLPLGHLPHQPFAGFGESDDRRRSPPTFFIRDNFRLSALHDGYAGVGGAKVNSNSLAHNASSSIDKCFTINVMMITLYTML